VGTTFSDFAVDAVAARRPQSEQRDIVALGETEQQLRGCLAAVPGVEVRRERRADENLANASCMATVTVQLVTGILGSRLTPGRIYRIARQR
jgi:hypothetical protein